MSGYQYGKKKKFHGIIAAVPLSIATFFVVIGLFLYGLSGISRDTTQREETSLRNALNRSIVSCYCTKGTYPPSLDYIKEHYGLTYDEEIFYVDYRAFGANIMPDVTIVRRQ